MEHILEPGMILNIPNGITKEVKSAVKTMSLTHAIQKDLAEGETLESILAARLPSTAVDKISEDAALIRAGIDSVYTAAAEEIDEQWVIQHLNGAMSDLDNVQRVKYLQNLISIFPKERFLDTDVLERVYALDSAECASDADVEFLLNAVRECIANDASILGRSSVQAMNRAMPNLDKSVVHELSQAGVETAYAYAAACYIMNQCGEDPWSTGESVAAQPAYTIGAIAAANIESSCLMSLYYAGKIRLNVLKNKLVSLFQSVIAFVAAHFARAIAVGLQISTGLGAAIWYLRFLLKVLHFGPWIALIGAAVLAYLTATKFVTTQDYEDLVNTVWSIVKAAWDWVKDLFHKVFRHDEAADRAEVNSTEEETEYYVAEDDEVETDEAKDDENEDDDDDDDLV